MGQIKHYDRNHTINGGRIIEWVGEISFAYSLGLFSFSGIVQNLLFNHIFKHFYRLHFVLGWFICPRLWHLLLFTIWQPSPAGDSTGPGGIFTVFSFLEYMATHRSIAELMIKQAQIIAKTSIIPGSTQIHTETLISHKHIIIRSIVLK